MAAVAVGAAWAAGGARALADFGLHVLRLLPALAIAVGLLALLRMFTPSGAVAGPLVLIGGGLLALAVQLGLLTGEVVESAGPVVVIGGGVAIAMSKRTRERLPVAGVVRRHWSVLLPRWPKFVAQVPRKLILRSVLGDLHADLSTAVFPEHGRITVDMTVLFGRVELTVPQTWRLVAGRLDLARGVRFPGEVRLASPDAPGGPRQIHLNVQGWFGMVKVVQAAVPPPASGPGEGPVASDLSSAEG